MVVDSFTIDYQIVNAQVVYNKADLDSLRRQAIDEIEALEVISSCMNQALSKCTRTVETIETTVLLDLEKLNESKKGTDSSLSNAMKRKTVAEEILKADVDYQAKKEEVNIIHYELFSLDRKIRALNRQFIRAHQEFKAKV